MKSRNVNFELKEIQTLGGHTDEILSVAWNPVTGVDNFPAKIASCGADKTVRIWGQNPFTDSFYCMDVLQNQHTDSIRWCVWSPTGNLLASSSFDGNVAIWKKYERSCEFSCVHVLEGEVKFAQSISWNASGTLFAACVPYGSTKIWRVSPNNWFKDVSGGLDSMGIRNGKIIQWHPLKDILFSSGFDSTIKVWEENADTGQWNCVQKLDEFTSGQMITVCDFAFNGTSDKMVTSCDDDTIKIWGSKIKRMRSGEEKSYWKYLCTLSGNHDLGFPSVDWSSLGIICSASSDKAICIFGDNEDGKVDEPDNRLPLKEKQAHDMDINAAQWSSMVDEPDNRLPLKEKQAHDMDINAARWSSMVDEPAYRLLLKKELAHDMRINAVQWSSMNSRCLVTASGDKTLKIWELVSSDPS